MMEYSESYIKGILNNPSGYKWTIQGFGMLRLWLDGEGIYRLHIWDTEQAYETTPSTVHTHPWDFRSRIIFGNLQNQRYRYDPSSGNPFNWARIHTGQGGGLTSEIESVNLSPLNTERYESEDSYHQFAEEIHESYPTKGTVTVISRNFRHNRQARVFWPANSQWATAEPRLATKEEVNHFISLVRM